MEQISLNFNDVDSSIKIFVTQNLAPIDALTSNEKKLTTGFAQKRHDHFNTGRYCAKMALSEIEVGNYEILKGEEGEPIWPEGFVGSISHTNGFYVAVVALRKRIKAIGLDIERIGKITNEMWNTIFTPHEQAFLKSKDVSEYAYYSTLFFSLKESFYKAQYPITKEKLWFTDLEVVIENDSYQIIVLKEFEGKHLLPQPMKFFIEKRDDFIICLSLV
jgi:phosphopantetheine--protein transferase-like protein